MFPSARHCSAISLEGIGHDEAHMSSGLIIALDLLDLCAAEGIVKETADLKGVCGFKIGFCLGLTHGLPHTVDRLRRLTKLPIIYDHQKAGTDIPETAESFVQACSAVDRIILFPQAGPKSLEAWVKAVQKAKKVVIVGGEMTHKGYKAREEGYITDVAPITIYRSAVKQGVTDFVVPANKTDSVGFYRMLLESSGIVPTLYLVGLVDQGGSIREAGKTAGPYWHAICGTAIYNPNKKESLDKVTEEEMHESIKKLAMSL